jgi:hypothetical protein
MNSEAVVTAWAGRWGDDTLTLSQKQVSRAFAGSPARPLAGAVA